MADNWDTPLVRVAYKQLLSDAQSEASQAHLLAAECNESGAWLNAIPVTSKDLIEDKVFRIPVGLRIGAPLVQLHVCCHCGKQID